MKTLISVLVLAFAATTFAQGTTQTQEKTEKSEKPACCQEESKAVTAKAAKKEDECCQSTEEKKVAKAEAGCCNAPGELAKFKVFVANEGYKFFGCKDSAAQGRSELVAKGLKVGQVQKVTSKIKL